MRFAAAHKATTYAMAMCSYLALVLSGELSGLIVLLGLGGIAVSWFWEPPRVRLERYHLVWNILSALVLAWTVLSALGGGDLILLGAEFLMYLLVAKLFNRRACKDYQHVYVLTFLMLVAGTVLNAELTYGVFFLAYVVCATWALILFHLRREMEDNFLLKHADERASQRVEVTRILNSRRIVGRGFFVGTSAVSLAIFLAASLLFLMIPRIGFGLFFSKSRAGVHMAGFSDGVTLGGHGTIKTDDTVVMRVYIDDAYQGRRAPYIHWRGVAFDRYEDGQWRRTPASPETRRQVTYPRDGRERHHLLYAREQTPHELARGILEGVRQEIYLEPIGYDVLFGASMPAAFEFDAGVGLRSPRRGHNDEMRMSHGAGLKYTVYSAIDPPAPALLRGAPDVVPGGYETYLQLPDDIPPRVAALAREITAGAETNYDKARALEQWLKTRLAYTLDMQSPGNMEPIDFFLFERKAGHCEYFSSAMAVMARAVGVPVRNVNGFLGGEWNEHGDYIAVRAGDAHSWVEVYFHGIGWVTFDPTPSAQIDRLGRGGDGLGARMRRLMDTMRFKWFKWVIEYDLHRQMSVLKGIGDALRGGSDGVKHQLRGARDWAGRHKGALAAGGGAVVVIIVLVAAWRQRRATPGTRRPPPRSQPRRAMARLYLRVLRRLDRRGHRRSPATTPREHARALASRGVPGGRDLIELTEMYYAAEYGGEPDEETLNRAQELARAIDAAARRRPSDARA